MKERDDGRRYGDLHSISHDVSSGEWRLCEICFDTLPITFESLKANNEAVTEIGLNLYYCEVVLKLSFTFPTTW